MKIIRCIIKLWSFQHPSELNQMHTKWTRYCCYIQWKWVCLLSIFESQKKVRHFYRDDSGGMSTSVWRPCTRATDNIAKTSKIEKMNLHGDKMVVKKIHNDIETYAHLTTTWCTVFHYLNPFLKGHHWAYAQSG